MTQTNIIFSELHQVEAFEVCPKWRKLLDHVNCGKTPAVNDLLQCSELFEDRAIFSMNNMSSDLKVSGGFLQ